MGSSGEIYHLPDSPWYKQTMPEVMFCTEEKAVKAGFRPQKQ
ncbi:sunset domain-containing protein [Cytobacillus praedii]